MYPPPTNLQPRLPKRHLRFFPLDWGWQQWSQTAWLKPRRAMCYAEWMLIAVQLLLGFLNGAYTFSTPVTIWGLLYLLAFAVLAYFIPLQGSLNQRRLYVLLNLLLLISTNIVVAIIPFDLIFFWGIIKTCFLLELPEVLIALVLTGIAFTLATAWGLPSLYHEVEQRGIDSFLNPKNLILGSISYYLGSCVFSVLLSGMILSERFSRQRAEALTQEVENLSIRLERARIARDLHDLLGHRLTTLGVQLEVAQKLRQQHPQQSLQALDNAKTLADDCLQAVRQSVQMLHPGSFNLARALEDLLIQMRQVNRFLLLTHIDLPTLPMNVQHQLYCIIQEGFSNIQKHAQASQVELRIRHTDEQLQLQLRDNGVGFASEAASPGLGLRILAERVSALAGEFHLVSHPGQGTLIEITLPR